MDDHGVPDEELEGRRSDMGAAVPGSTLCRLFDCTNQYLLRLARDGIITKVGRNQYAITPSVRGYIAYLRARVPKGRNTKAVNDDTNFQAERARWTKARADTAELNHQERLGEMIHRDHAEGAWIAILATVRTRVLSIPNRAAGLVQDASSIGEAREIINDLVLETLEELASLNVEIERPEIIDDDGDPVAEESSDPGPLDATSAA